MTPIFSFTDDRIRLIENEGMMTPRDLAERKGVSTAAISQWSKPLIEKGVLTWCNETGVDFDGDLALEKAKRSGKAYLFVAGGKNLMVIIKDLHIKKFTRKFFYLVQV